MNDNPACCAHSIVMHSHVNDGSGKWPDAVTAAWHCCDCGARFIADQSLPTFAPEKSYLHKRLNVLAADAKKNERVLAAMTQWLQDNQPDVFRRGLWDAINPFLPSGSDGKGGT